MTRALIPCYTNMPGKVKINIILLVSLLAVSCSSEKVNISPVSDTFLASSGSFNYTQDQTVTASEISNLISTFPRLRNDAVNKEVSNLKAALSNFLRAHQSSNVILSNTATLEYEKSYKKIQKLRQYLTSDDEEVLNRYLVRIKTNIAFLQQEVDSTRAYSRQDD